jgi:hypothetical protein
MRLERRGRDQWFLDVVLGTSLGTFIGDKV